MSKNDLEEHLQENEENHNLLNWLKELLAYRKGPNKKILNL